MSDWTKDQEWLDEFIRTTITSNLISPLDAVAKLAVYIRDVVEKRLKHFMEAPSEYEDARLESIEKRLKDVETQHQAHVEWALECLSPPPQPSPACKDESDADAVCRILDITVARYPEGRLTVEDGQLIECPEGHVRRADAVWWCPDCRTTYIPPMPPHRFSDVTWRPHLTIDRVLAALEAKEMSYILEDIGTESEEYVHEAAVVRPSGETAGIGQGQNPFKAICNAVRAWGESKEKGDEGS